MNFTTIFLFISAICFIDGLTILQTDCKRFKLRNGRIRSKPRAKLHRFFCNKGYQLVGEKYGYCTNGFFDISLPICVKPTCKKMPEWKSGVLFPFVNGAVIHFYCKSNYKLLGNNITYCDGDNWVNHLPTCVASGEKPALSCDFEDSDICGWSDDLNHDIDWIRRNSSSFNGMKSNLRFDHTNGERSTGNYMTLDYLARMDNTARLYSPLYSNMSSVCFTFYYHLFGSISGTLNVYIKKITEEFETLSPMFTVSKHHNDDWNLGKIEIDDGVSEDFQIIFEAVRGAHYLSNIAIDDVKLSAKCLEDLEYNSSSTEYTIWEDFSTISLGLESCENRCDLNETLETDACQCTESCIENKSCCADYLIVCGWYTQSIDDELIGTELSPLTEVTISVTQEATQTTEIVGVTTRTSELPPKIMTVTKSTPTSTTMATTKKITEATTKKPTTTTIKPTTPTTIKPTTPTTKKPTTPTTKKPTTPIKKLTPTTMKSIATTMFMNKVLPTGKQMTTADALADLEDTFGTLPIETDYADDEDHTAKTQIFHSNENLKTTYPNVQFLSNKEKSNPTRMSHESLLKIGISSILGILFLLTTALVAAKKYKFRCAHLKKKNRKNNDSMSDVRFLTNDEVLDFTWRTEE